MCSPNSMSKWSVTMKNETETKSRTGRREWKDTTQPPLLSQISQNLLQRLPPQNIEAEQAVLGGVFLRNSIFHSLIDILQTDDFYTPVHQTIYKTFLDLYRQN